MSYYSDMKKGHKEFSEARKEWSRRADQEPAWRTERKEIKEVLDSDSFEEFIFVTIDDPALWSSFFGLDPDRGLVFPRYGKVEFWRTLINGQFEIPWGDTNIYDWEILAAYENIPVEDLTKTEREVLVNISLQQVYLFPNEGDRYLDAQGREREQIPPLMVGRYEVTQVLWAEVLKGTKNVNPSEFQGATRPVENVSWGECLVFCDRLSRKMGLQLCYEPTEEGTWKWNRKANGYRLPTSKEWTLAAEGGDGFVYAGSDDIKEVAWYAGNGGRRTHAVGQLKMNGIQTFDMSGNVWEWTWTGNVGERVSRGGSWYGNAGNARVSLRRWYFASRRLSRQGFRFVRNMGKDD